MVGTVFGRTHYWFWRYDVVYDIVWFIDYRFFSGEDTDSKEITEQTTPSFFDYIMHYLTLPWKLLVACCPPTSKLKNFQQSIHCVSKSAYLRLLERLVVFCLFDNIDWIFHGNHWRFGELFWMFHWIEGCRDSNQFCGHGNQRTR